MSTVQETAGHRHHHHHHHLTDAEASRMPEGTNNAVPGAPPIVYQEARLRDVESGYLPSTALAPPANTTTQPPGNQVVYQPVPVQPAAQQPVANNSVGSSPVQTMMCGLQMCTCLVFLACIIIIIVIIISVLSALHRLQRKTGV
jgi:hypothetical protein